MNATSDYRPYEKFICLGNLESGTVVAEQNLFHKLMFSWLIVWLIIQKHTVTGELRCNVSTNRADWCFCVYALVVEDRESTKHVAHKHVVHSLPALKYNPLSTFCKWPCCKLWVSQKACRLSAPLIQIPTRLITGDEPPGFSGQEKAILNMQMTWAHLCFHAHHVLKLCSQHYY